MRAVLEWTGAETYRARVEGSDHELTIDGNWQAGPSPMQLVLQAFGGCSCMDVVMILEKGRHTVTGCRCELTAERAESPPRVFTRIHAHYRVEGRALKEAAVARAVALSLEKYCSVAKMIEGAVVIDSSHEVVEVD